jgi:hypothetical protein
MDAQMPKKTEEGTKLITYMGGGFVIRDLRV